MRSLFEVTRLAYMEVSETELVISNNTVEADFIRIQHLFRNSIIGLNVIRERKFDRISNHCLVVSVHSWQ